MGRSSPPISTPVLSDEEIAAQIAEQIAAKNPGQPQEWLNDLIGPAVEQELMERRALQEWSQREYNKQVGNA